MSNRTTTRPSVLRPLLSAVAAALLLSACGSEPEQAGAMPATVPDEDPGLVHVHGLGVDPADGRLYVATHFGLWRIDGPGDARRVGEYFYDLMGFTVVGDDHFLASGHPLLTDDLPPLLGLIETTDAGQTWRSVSLLGSVDFHALRAEHGLVYGWNSSDGAFMVSSDLEEWERRSTQRSLLDFAVDPDDPDHVVASTAESFEAAVLLRSRDGGSTWTPIEESDAPPVARLSWSQPDRLWAVGLDGSVWRSGDDGATWERTGQAAGRPEAFLDAGDTLVVAGGGIIAESGDGGRTWEELFREDEHP
jgi:hypothetical protein